MLPVLVPSPGHFCLLRLGGLGIVLWLDDKPGEENAERGEESLLHSCACLLS